MSIGVSNLGLLRKSLYSSLGNIYNERMRTATAIVLIALGVIGLALSAVVLLRLPVPLILQSLVGVVGSQMIPVKGALSSLVLLIFGVALLRRP
jgi:hypothetical protein